MINSILVFLAAQLVALPVIALVVLLVAWRAKAPKQKFSVFASEALVRLWAFWGRRLGDKNFQGALYAVAAGALGTYFAPEQVQAILLILTVVGAFIASPWENMPFEDLAGERPGPSIGTEQRHAD